MGGDNGTLAPANIVKICVFSYGPGGMVYKEGGGGVKKNQFKIPTRLWIFYKSEVRIYENYDAERLKEIVTISSSL